MNQNQINAMMQEAVRLAYKGYPAPNPHVGCVITAGGMIVGRGFHNAAGQAHAEAMALAGAGDLALNGEAFVTLEPCAHTGRTPPCADALIAAGIKRVYIGQKDPNPAARGGIEKLLDAGVDVFTGILEEECREVNLRWLTAVERRRPWVTLKAAITMDGRIARPDGTSKWITGEEARAEAHRLRAEHSAILVGPGTAMADNPSLTARTEGVVNQPLRIVLDEKRTLPDDLNVWNPSTPCWRVVSTEFAKLQDHGIKWVEGRADISTFLDELFAADCTSLLIEGGAGMYRAFLEAGLVDEICLFTSPKLFGAGLSWLPDGRELDCEWRSLDVKRFGEDVLLRYRRVVLSGAAELM